MRPALILLPALVLLAGLSSSRASSEPAPAGDGDVEMTAAAARAKPPVRDLQAGFTAYAAAISQNGTIVGSGNSRNGAVRWAFVSTGGNAKKTPHFKSTNIEGWGVNDAGISVGDFYDPNGVPQPFRGKMKLGTLGSVGGQAFDINNAGVAVGALLGVNPTPAVQWDPNGVPSTLGTGRPFSINSAGVIAGDSGLPTRPRMWKDGRQIDLPTFGFTSPLGVGSVNKINDSEEMVGWIAVANGHFHAALWKNGTVTDLTPGDPSNSSATAINNHSQVIGSRSLAGAFIWDPVHGFVDFNCLLDPNSTDSPGFNDLNDKGQIVGEGCVKGKCRKAVLFDLNLIPAGSGTCPVPRLSAIEGVVEFEKVKVDATGLRTDLSPLQTPAAGVTVELVDAGTGATIASAVTDGTGSYRLLADFTGPVRLRAVAGSAEGTVVGVADEILYSVVGSDFNLTSGQDAHQDLLATDATRASGPFNILDSLRLAGIWVHAAEPAVSVPPVKVRWSPTSTSGTDFDPVSNVARVKGDRTSDSDEFDDTVLNHEYAHYLQVRLSRSDDHGGVHSIKDVLDPRLAWGEGWADFFGVASLDLTGASSLYFDSIASGVFSFDLEQNNLVGSTPGYWDEHSVASAVWDLFDAPNDTGDTGQLPVPQIWQGFRDVKSDTFLYLIDYMDRLAAADPTVGPLLTSVLAERQMTYSPGVVPSVPNPFPAPIDSGVPVTGSVDSLTAQRDNLLSSSAFYGFTLGGTSTLDATLDITGGPVGNNDLDLALLDDQGASIVASMNSGTTSETLHQDLPAGFYVLQVKSFSGSGVNEIFNKGDFMLSLGLSVSNASLDADPAATASGAGGEEKPSAPIRIQVAPGAILSPGRQRLHVSAAPLVSGESLTLKVVAQQGLAIESAMPGALLEGPGAAGTATAADFVVALGARGEGRLLVEATLTLDDGSRQTAIALWGGKGTGAAVASRPAGSRVVTTPDGRQILEIPSGRR